MTWQLGKQISICFGRGHRSTRKPWCRKETARCRSYSGRFSLPWCCISFSSSYEYHVDL